MENDMTFSYEAEEMHAGAAEYEERRDYAQAMEDTLAGCSPDGQIYEG